MSKTTQELIWLKSLLIYLGVTLTQPMRLYCDNMVALHISAYTIFYERTKHIERDYHFIRDEVKADNLATAHVSTKAQLTDIFTKAFKKCEFDSFRAKLGISNLHVPAWGVLENILTFIYFPYLVCLHISHIFLFLITVAWAARIKPYLYSCI